MRHWNQVISQAAGKLLSLSVVAWSLAGSDAVAQTYPYPKISPPSDKAQQFTRAQIRSQDIETDNLIRVTQARTTFSVDGTGLTVAVLDTGLRTTHVDFAGKVLTQVNFTTDNGANPNDANDGDGHGTNVGGIIVGRGIHTGIAPGGNIIPIKVLGNNGSGSFASVDSALQWVLTNRVTYNITAVNMSLGADSNQTTDFFPGDPIVSKIQQLRAAKVAVVVSAGNSFFSFGSQQGMAYPAIIRETTSVGALYDANIGPVFYGSGASAITTGPGRFTPFSQRLHPNVNPITRTDIFTPGAALTAAGIANDTAESTFHGTSQAAPTACGLILLAQEYYRRRTNTFPTVDQLENWMRKTSAFTTRFDGDDENDNVTNTNLSYACADAVEMLNAAKTEIDTSNPPAPTPSLVNVAWNSGTKTLTLTGDLNANSISMSLAGTQLRVEGGAGTKIRYNNVTSTSATITGVSGKVKVTGDMGNGNDTVAAVKMQLSTVDLKLGLGNDRVILNYCNVDSLKIDGGAGTDTFTGTTSKILSNQSIGFP
jgi:hypothetical protein